MTTDRSFVAPMWLSGGAILSLGAAMVIFLGDPGALNAVYLVVMALVSLASLFGSRVGWSLLLLIALTVVIEFVLSAKSGAVAAVWGVIAIALLTPSSVKFVWRRKRKPMFASPGVDRYWSAMQATMYGIIAWLAQWEAGRSGEEVAQGRSFGVLLWRLGYCCAGLFFVYVVAFNMQSGEEGGGVGIVDIVAAVSRAGFVISLLLFLGVVFAAALARLKRGPNSPKAG